MPLYLFSLDIQIHDRWLRLSLGVWCHVVGLEEGEMVSRMGRGLRGRRVREVVNNAWTDQLVVERKGKLKGGWGRLSAEQARRLSTIRAGEVSNSNGAVFRVLDMATWVSYQLLEVLWRHSIERLSSIPIAVNGQTDDLAL